MITSKLQQAITHVEDAVAFAAHPRASLATMFSSWSMFLGITGFLSMPFTIMAMAPFMAQHWVLLSSVGIAVGVLGLFQVLSHKSYKKWHNHYITAQNKLTKEMLAPAGSEYKLSVLKKAKTIGLDDHLLQSLSSVSVRTDVPKGWWDVVHAQLVEEISRNQIERQVQQAQIHYKTIEEELKNFGFASADRQVINEVVHIEAEPKEEVVRTDVPITKHINL